MVILLKSSVQAWGKKYSTFNYIQTVCDCPSNHHTRFEAQVEIGSNLKGDKVGSVPCKI